MAHILLIEDDDAVRGVFDEIITRPGQPVVEAGDSVEGFALFVPAAFDLG